MPGKRRLSAECAECMMVDMPRGKKRKKAKPFVTVEGLEELA